MDERQTVNSSRFWLRSCYTLLIVYLGGTEHSSDASPLHPNSLCLSIALHLRAILRPQFNIHVINTANCENLDYINNELICMCRSLFCPIFLTPFLLEPQHSEGKYKWFFLPPSAWLCYHRHCSKLASPLYSSHLSQRKGDISQVHPDGPLLPVTTPVSVHQHELSGEVCPYVCRGSKGSAGLGHAWPWHRPSGLGVTWY